MSSTVVALSVLLSVVLSSSLVVAFVLQPPSSAAAAAAAAAAGPRPPRCRAESWQSVREGLLGALGLRAEPRLAPGGLDAVREQWQRTFSTIAHRGHDAPPVVPGSSVSQDNGNATSLKCCSVTSEVHMKDLGWENWVIHPLSLTLVQCSRCSSAGDALQPPSPPAGGQEPCCQPSSHQVVPVLYMDELSTLVISSVQLPRGCTAE